MRGNEQVSVDKHELSSIVEEVIAQLVASVEGSTTEDARIDRKKMCDLIEQARLRGEGKVFELLVFDLIVRTGIYPMPDRITNRIET